MFNRQAWAKGLGIVAVAAILALGGLVGRASSTSAQSLMWFDPVTGMVFPYAASTSAYPIEVPITTAAAGPNIYVSPAASYVAPTTYVAPAVSYSSTVPNVYAAPFSWVSPGGSYCSIGNDQIWVPAGADPHSYGC